MKSQLKQAVSLERILKYWDALKEDGVRDRVSIRVMEGMIYSLMDDDEFYEEQGCRRAINILTVSISSEMLRCLRMKKSIGVQGSSIAILNRRDISSSP